MADLALTARQRVEFRVARALNRLSPRVQVRLSGRPPVRLDGQTLEPDWQLALAMLERQGAVPVEDLPLPQARHELRAQALVAGGPPVPVRSVRDLTVDGGDGPLPARHYAGDDGAPLLVFFHGGGFVLGDLDSHDGVCRLLVKHAGCHVLSVDYRLAPEHPFPAAVEDGLASFRWAVANAQALGADPSRVAVGGDSAGGGISAVTAWQAARDGGPAPCLQLLLYPVVDEVEVRPSRDLFAEGFLLTRKQMTWFADQYGAGADVSDPRISVLQAEDLTGLAPAIVVTAGFDPLRDEGEAYAHKLQDAGVPALLRRFPGQIHGFVNAAGISPSSRDAVAEIGGMARAAFAAVALGASTLSEVSGSA